MSIEHTGQVIDQITGHGLPGRRVEAWDADGIQRDMIAYAVTDEDGYFAMQLEEADVISLFGERAARAYFVVIDTDSTPNTIEADTSDAIIWDLRADDSESRIHADEAATANAEPLAKSVVRGVVYDVEEGPASGYTVKAFNVRFGQADQQLGSNATVDARGRYRIEYDASAILPNGKMLADIEVVVMIDSSTYARSAVRCQAPATYIVDPVTDGTTALVAEGTAYRGKPEVDDVDTAVAAAADGTAVKDIPDEEIAAVACSAARTEEDVRALRDAEVLALDLTSISRDALYSMIRDGNAGDKYGLLSVPAAQLKSQLSQAVAARRQPHMTDTAIEQVRRDLVEAQVTAAFDPPTVGSTNLGDVVEIALDANTPKSEGFIRRYARSEVDPATFWDDLTFAPTDLDDCFGWFRTDKEVYEDTGFVLAVSKDLDPVGGWKDNSLATNDAIQATSGDQPEWRINDGFASIPGIRLSTTAPDHLTLSPSETSDSYSVVFRLDQGGSGRRVALSSTGGNTLTLCIDDGSGQMSIDDGSSRQIGPTPGNGDNTYAWVLDAAGKTVTGYVNGALIGSTAWSGTGRFDASTDIGKDDGAGTGPIDGTVREIIMYSRVLSAGELRRVHAYAVRSDFQAYTASERSRLQMTLQWGVLTRYHKPLIDKLETLRVSNSWTDVRPIAMYDESDWDVVLSGVTPQFPADIPGADPTEQKANYIALLAKTMEGAQPTAQFHGRFANDLAKPLSEPESTDLTNFFADNTAFRFHDKRVAQIFKEGAVLTGVTDQVALKKNLKRIERLFHLTSVYDQVKALMNAGIYSAQGAVRTGEPRFVASMSSAFGGDEAARAVYQKARSQAGAATILRMMYSSEANAPTPRAVANWQASSAAIDSAAELAEWEELFGSQDARRCEPCESVLSPSAYLVDLLELLQRHPADPAAPLGKTARDVLLGDGTTTPGRRPDIAQIALTCTNTNTAMPYVDLVNELLERRIAGWTPSLLPQVQVWLRAAERTYTDTAATTPASDNDAVRAWVDAVNSVKFESTNAPLLSASHQTLNGRAALRFDGTDDYLQLADATPLASGTSHTFFWALDVDALNDGERLLTCNGTSFVVYAQQSSELAIRNNGADVGVGAAAAAGKQIISLTLDAASGRAQFRINGAEVGAPIAYVGVAVDVGVMTLLAANSGGNELDADIAEFVWCNEALSNTDVATAERYLAARYGVRLAGPTPVIESKGTSAELMAAPEIVDQASHDGAYDALSQAIYPWKLPFAKWQAQDRIYLEHLGVPRHRLMHELVGFKPSDIAMCKLWLRADLGVTLSEDRVSSWSDLSGNGGSATQTAAAAPRYGQAAGPGAIAYVQFDGGEALSVEGAALDGAPMTVFAIASHVPDGEGWIVGKGKDAAMNYGVRQDSAGKLSAAYSGGVFRAGGDFNATGAKPVCGLVEMTTSSTALRRNGAETSDSSANTMTTNTDAMSIGARATGSSYDAFFQGRIYEIVIYNAVLSAADKRALEGYARRRHGADVTLMAVADLQQAQERCRLSKVGREIIVGAPPAGVDAWDLWGLSETIGSENWADYLSSVRNFADVSGLSYDEVRELLDARVLTPFTIANEQPEIHPKPGGDPAKIDDLVIARLSDKAGAWDMTQRFLRLRDKLGWSIRDTDKLVTSLGGSLDDDMIEDVARLLDLRETRRLRRMPLEEIAAWWADIDTQAMPSLDERSLYEEVFLNRAVSHPLPAAFGLSVLAGSSDDFSDHIDHILGSVGMSSNDYQAITDAAAAEARMALAPMVNDTAMSLANLSRLYRVASIARALRMPIVDIAIMQALTGLSPLAGDGGVADASPGQAKRFIDALDAAKALDLGAAQLNYLSRHVVQPGSGVTAEIERVAAVRDQIDAAVADIVDETTYMESATAADLHDLLERVVREADPSLASHDAVAAASAMVEIVEGRSSLSDSAQDAKIDDVLGGILSSATIVAIKDALLFRPYDVKGCEIWLEPADIQQTAGDVDAWTDISPTPVTVDQITAADQPRYVSAGPYGLPAVSFDGSGKHLDIAHNYTSTSHTFVSVIDQPTQDSASSLFDTKEGSSSLVLKAETTTAKMIGFNDGVEISVASNQRGEQMLTWAFDAALKVAEIYRDGASIGTGAYVNARSLGSTHAQLGGLNAADAFEGDVSLFAIFSRRLGGSELQRVHDYVATICGNTPKTRYQAIHEPLLDHIRRRDSEVAVKQIASDAFDVTAAQANTMLSDMLSSVSARSARLIDDLLPAGHNSETPAPSADDKSRAITRFAKAASILRAMGVGDDDAAWLAAHRAPRWLDFDALPVERKQRFDTATAKRIDGSYLLPSWMDIRCATSERSAPTSPSAVRTGFGANAARASSQDGATWGLLIEPATTNHITQQDVSAYTTGVATVVADVTDPTGGLAAYRIADTDAGAAQSKSNTFSVDGTADYTMSCWLRVPGDPTTHASVEFSAAGVTVADESLAWGPYASTATTGDASLVINPRATTIADEGGCDIWGVQIEKRSYPTSFMGADNTAFTRAADVLRVSARGLGLVSDDYFDATISYAPLYASAETTQDHDMIYLDDDNRVYFSASDQKIYLRLNGATQLSTDALSFGRHSQLEVTVSSKPSGTTLTVAGAAESGPHTGAAQTMTIPASIHVLGNASGAQEGAELRSIEWRPATPMSDIEAARERFWGLMNLAELMALRRTFQATDAMLFDLIDSAQALSEDQFVSAMATQAAWSGTDASQAAASLGLVYPAASTSEQGLKAMSRAMSSLSRLGVPASRVLTWLDVDETASAGSAVANDIVNAAQAKHSPESWLALAPSLRSPLRDAQREALLAHLIDINAAVDDADALFADLLVDVEMTACAKTSRLKQAISSVQLFIQRCLLGIEPDVELTNVAAREFVHMRNYRVWEANRKVMLWPENWLEPDWRLDRTPLFDEAAAVLRQNALTNDTIDEAYRVYVNGLVEVAKLDVVAVRHHQEPATSMLAAVDELHVLARSNGNPPHRYFYRKRIHGVRWTPWQHVDLDLRGESFLLVVHDGILHLVWMETENLGARELKYKLRSAPEGLKITLRHARLENGTWSRQRRVAEQPEAYLFDADPSQISLAQMATTPERIVVLAISGRMDIRLAQVGAFEFAPYSGELVHIESAGDVRMDIPTSAGFYGTSYIAGSGSEVRISMSRPLLPGQTINHALLPATPLPFSLVVDQMATPATPLDDYEKFFFRDADRAFYGHVVNTSRVAEPLEQSSEITPSAFSKAGVLAASFVLGAPYEPPADSVQAPVVHLSRKVLLETFMHDRVADLQGALVRNDSNLLRQANFEVFTTDELVITTPIQFAQTYQPTHHVATPYPDDGFDFSYAGAYGQYNWELAFHLPYLIATRLMEEERHEEARQIWHAIFDPSDANGESVHRFWKSRPLYELDDLMATQDAIVSPPVSPSPGLRLVQSMLSRSSQVDVDMDQVGVHHLMEQLVSHPFRPFLIADLRPVAFQKATVMRYIDNLIDWGDKLFRRDTIESVAEATQLYLLAKEILGDRPELVAPPDAFTPTDVADCALWLRADGGLTMGDGNRVASWSDQSGNGNDLTQATAAAQPVLQASSTAINDQPAITFDAAAASSLAGSMSGIAAGASYTVVAVVNVQNNNASIVELSDTASTSDRVLRLFNDGSGNMTVRATSASGDADFASSNDWVVISATHDSSGRSIYENDGSDTTTTFTDSANAPSITKLGDAEAGGSPLEGGIAEIVVYKRKLTDSEREQVVAYAMERYGLIEAERNEALTYERLEAGLADSAVESTALTQPASSLPFDATGMPLLPPQFCIPPNDTLMKKWDVVDDRLFKIRHCLNIEGVARELPLFEPPIDPAVLIEAFANGADLSSVLDELAAPRPHYRFAMLVPRASDLVQTVIGFGSSLLSALEKKDGEDLSLLRQRQELGILDMVRSIRTEQIVEAKTTLDSLKLSRTIVEKRHEFYREVERTSAGESLALKGAKQATDMTVSSQLMQSGASALTGVPQLGVITGMLSGQSTEIGGIHLAKGVEAAATVLGILSASVRQKADRAGATAGYTRRWQDWKLQEELAERELKQIDKQIAAAELRVAITERELQQVEQQREDAKDVETFLKDKFSNRELYSWMSGQLSQTYHQAYKLAYEMCKYAQQAYRFERADPAARFISFGYWDSRRKGLVAGEKLLIDLRRMETAYLKSDRRQYEISKSVSLAEHMPANLVELRQQGTTTLQLPESLFDGDYPGHFMRRIKSVSLTIPAVTGPHTSVNCKLTLLSSKMRAASEVGAGGYTEDAANPDSRFIYDFGAISSVCTSSGQNDSGLFELNFRDERYLPFEGSGAISTWRIELPPETNRFDLSTVTDVVIQMSYMAREGGDALKEAALEATLRSQPRQAVRLFSMRHEFPSEWYKFENELNGADDQELTFTLDGKLPYLRGVGPIDVTACRIAARWADESAAFDAQVTPAGGTETPLVVQPTPDVHTALSGTFETGSWKIRIPETVITGLTGLTEPYGGANRIKPDALLDLFFIVELEREPVE